MLAKANRIVSAADYRGLVRGGRRAGGPVLLAYGRTTRPDRPLRMGVIVARNVGTAVTRNRVRRRIRAIGWSVARDTGGLDVVVRALPAAAAAEFAVLDSEVRRLVTAVGRPR